MPSDKHLPQICTEAKLYLWYFCTKLYFTFTYTIFSISKFDHKFWIYPWRPWIELAWENSVVVSMRASWKQIEIWVTPLIALPLMIWYLKSLALLLLLPLVHVAKMVDTLHMHIFVHLLLLSTVCPSKLILGCLEVVATARWACTQRTWGTTGATAFYSEIKDWCIGVSTGGGDNSLSSWNDFILDLFKSK